MRISAESATRLRNETVPSRNRVALEFTVAESVFPISEIHSDFASDVALELSGCATG